MFWIRITLKSVGKVENDKKCDQDKETFLKQLKANMETKLARIISDG